jgi:acyl carrier protein
MGDSGAGAFPFDLLAGQAQIRSNSSMGLDAVEIVIRVEDAFDIAIEDSEAEKMMTPRDVIEYVTRKVGRTDRAQCLTQRAFHRIRASLIRHAGLKRVEIKPAVPTGKLFPVRQRKELLGKTLEDIGVAASPEMVRPKWLVGLLFALSIAAGMAAMVCVARNSNSASFIVNLMAVSPLITAGIVAISFGCILSRLTHELRYEFKPALTTVGGFSRWIVANGPEIVGAPPDEWSREQIAEKVREIVNDQLGCEKIYQEDALFVKDLGLS